MKLSELIAKAGEVYLKHGDLEVIMEQDNNDICDARGCWVYEKEKFSEEFFCISHWEYHVSYTDAE